MGINCGTEKQKDTVVKMLDPLLLGAKSARRLTQTAFVLGNTGKNWLLGKRPPRPQLLRALFEDLGSTYIKLGQFIASSPSFFPDEYVQAFQDCLDNTPALPFPTIEKVIRDSLGKPLYKCFREIDPAPLASASIAQVHAATLISGEDVVVKVQKPGVSHILQTDLHFLYVIARLLEKIAPNLSMASLSEIVEEIQNSMMGECDFLQEAENIKTFQKFLEKTQNDQVIAPKVYDDYCSTRVLTQERLYGVPFTDLERARHYTSDPQQSLINAMNTWFATVLSAPSFHADVHAGNLLVLHDGRVGFIDFGIVGYVSPNTWAAITAFIQAVSSSDFKAMATAMIGIGVTHDTVDAKALAKDIESLYHTFGATNASNAISNLDAASLNVSEQEVNDILLRLMNLGKEYGIHFPREFALLLKQMLYFDRYLQLLAPEVNILNDERFSFLEPDTLP
jgi:predicted unusual protein kinase regulating ubiquinone biosynthesis (AarF/ABC1/UbiB family)